MKAPAFQFYPQDFISSLDVQVMNVEQVGAYMLLLSNAWIHEPQGYLPNNELLLQRICRMNDKQWSKNKSLILKKFEKDGELIFNARLIKELEKQGEYRKKQAQNGAKGGRPKANDNPEKPTALSGLTQTEPKKSSSFSISSSSSFSTSTSNVLLEKEPKSDQGFKDENSDSLKAEPKKPKEKSSAKKEKGARPWADLISFEDNDTPELRAKWQEWIEYKKLVGSSYKTQNGEQAELNKIKKYPLQFALYTIQLAIDKEWQGVVNKGTPTDYQQYANNPAAFLASKTNLPTLQANGQSNYYNERQQSTNGVGADLETAVAMSRLIVSDGYKQAG